MAEVLKMFGAEVFHIYEIMEFEVFGIKFNLLQILIWGFIATALIYFLKKGFGD